LVDGIEKLSPGEWLEWTDGEISTDAYWRLPFGASSNYTLESAKTRWTRCSKMRFASI